MLSHRNDFHITKALSVEVIELYTYFPLSLPLFFFFLAFKTFLRSLCKLYFAFEHFSMKYMNSNLNANRELQPKKKAFQIVNLFEIFLFIKASSLKSRQWFGEINKTVGGKIRNSEYFDANFILTRLKNFYSFENIKCVIKVNASYCTKSAMLSVIMWNDELNWHSTLYKLKRVYDWVHDFLSFPSV